MEYEAHRSGGQPHPTTGLRRRFDPPRLAAAGSDLDPVVDSALRGGDSPDVEHSSHSGRRVFGWLAAALGAILLVLALGAIFTGAKLQAYIFLPPAALIVAGVQLIRGSG